MDRSFDVVWVTQTVLGEEFGWKSVETGRCLQHMGLREGAEPTPKALTEGFAQAEPRIDANGKAYSLVRWDQDRVRELIRAYVRSRGGFRPTTQSFLTPAEHRETMTNRILDQLPQLRSPDSPLSNRELGAQLAELSKRITFIEARLSLTGVLVVAAGN